VCPFLKNEITKYLESYTQSKYDEKLKKYNKKSDLTTKIWYKPKPVISFLTSN